MAAIKYSKKEELILNPLRTLFSSNSVLSKQSIIDKGLVAAVVDDHHLFGEEGHALINAFKHLGAKTINWCTTDDLLNPSNSAKIHVVDCTYDGLYAGYLKFDESILYWDHILFSDNLDALVLHTAHDHTIYAGPELFVNEATQRKNQFRDGWLSVIGQAFSDPELIAEYELQEKKDSEN